jgi:hypothetical protein
MHSALRAVDPQSLMAGGCDPNKKELGEAMKVSNANTPERERNSVLTAAKWSVLVLCIVFILSLYGWFMYQIWTQPAWFTELARQHYPAVIGLPFAAVGALGVVILVEMTNGELEFNALGLALKGTAGQAVLWLACFLGITLAIKLLW